MPAFKPPTAFPGIESLPRPIRSLVTSLFPQEPQLPTPVATTIGPKAIPLWDPQRYLNKVMRTTLEEAEPVITGPLTTKGIHLNRAVSSIENVADPSAVERIINLLAKAYTSGPFDR